MKARWMAMGWLAATMLLSSVASAAAGGSLRPVYDAGRGHLVRDLVIGEREGDPLLVLPLPPVVDRDGNIIVADLRLPALFKFSPEGDLLWTADSKGQGPGDLLTPTNVALRPDGSVLVYDVGNRRFSVFSRAGEPAGTTHFSEVVWDCAVGPSGAVYIETHERTYGVPREPTTIRIERLAPDFSTRAVVDSARILTDLYVENYPGNIPVPFRPSLAWSVAPAGNLVVARSADYSIRVYGPDGKTVAHTRHEATRQPVTDNDKRRYFEGMTTATGDVVRHGAPDVVRDNAEFPKFKPYFTGVVTDPEGYILVGTYEKQGDLGGWDVFSPRAEFVGRVWLPRLGVFAGGYVYRVEMPEDEAPVTIVRYRLEPGT